MSTEEPRTKLIFDFLRSRDARMACPFCGHEDWHGWDERIELEHVVGSATVDRGTTAFPLTCANCGFIRLQSAHVLDDPRSPTRPARS
jgi:transcription elongation factor Elf1